MRCLLCMVLLLTGCGDREAADTPVEPVRLAKIITVTRTGSDVVHEFSARTEAFQSVDLSFEFHSTYAMLAEQRLKSQKIGKSFRYWWQTPY